MLLVMWYNFWSIPFRLSFLRKYLGTIPSQTTFTILDVLTDIISIIDLSLAFFKRYSGPDGIFVYDRKKTAKYYLSNWFIIDLLSCCIIDWAFIGWYPLIAVFIRLTRLARVLKMTYYFKELQTYVVIVTGTLIRIVSYIAIVLMVTHILACGWYLVCEAEDPALVYAWTTRPYLMDDSTHILSRYLTGFHWVLTSMTGYGGTLPATYLQVLYSEAVVLIGVVVYVVVIGTVGSLVSASNSNEAKSKQKMDEMKEYMQFRKLPEELQEKIRDYYTFLWKSRKGWDEKIILEDLPQYLRMEIALDINRDLIEKVPLFKDRSKMFISQVVMSLQPRVTLPGSHIVNKGEIGREMYFISNGSVEIISEDVPPKVFVTLGPGTFFGEISIVFDQRRNATVRAATFCDLYVLTKESFEIIEKDYPQEVAAIRELAQKRLDEVADQQKAAQQKKEEEERLKREEEEKQQQQESSSNTDDEQNK
jgi:CRP-like cAMP-binding protein